MNYNVHGDSGRVKMISLNAILGSIIYQVPLFNSNS